MFVISITGGIASGKSALTEYLRPEAAAIVDADAIAHEVMAPGGPAYQPVVERFGPGILTGGRVINRHALADIVFNDPGALRDLNGITHPIIAATINERLTELRRTLPLAAIVILRAPLLLEAGLADAGDLNVVVTAPEDVRLNRIVNFRGGTPEEARRRMAAQMRDEERAKYADMIIENTADRSALADAAEKIVASARRSGPERAI